MTVSRCASSITWIELSSPGAGGRSLMATHTGSVDLLEMGMATAPCPPRLGTMLDSPTATLLSTIGCQGLAAPAICAAMKMEDTNATAVCGRGIGAALPAATGREQCPERDLPRRLE